jgi:hypothetical protein
LPSGTILHIAGWTRTVAGVKYVRFSATFATQAARRANKSQRKRPRKGSRPVHSRAVLFLRFGSCVDPPPRLHPSSKSADQ